MQGDFDGSGRVQDVDALEGVFGVDVDGGGFFEPMYAKSIVREGVDKGLFGGRKSGLLEKFEKEAVQSELV